MAAALKAKLAVSVLSSIFAITPTPLFSGMALLTGKNDDCRAQYPLGRFWRALIERFRLFGEGADVR
jgi:hypothetical protein